MTVFLTRKTVQHVSSLRAGRSVFLGVLTLFALLAAQIFNFRLTHENKIKSLNQDLASAGIDLSARYENSRDFLLRLAETRSENSLTESAFRELSEQHMHKSPEIIDIFYFNAQGEVSWNARGAGSSALESFEPERLLSDSSDRSGYQAEGLSDVLAALPDASRIFRLKNGNVALSAVETSFRKSKFLGFFVAVIELPFFVQMALKPNVRESYSIQMNPKNLDSLTRDLAEKPILSDRQEEADLNYKASTQVSLGGYHFDFQLIRLRENSLAFTVFLQALSGAFALALLWSVFMLVRDNTRRKELSLQLEAAKASAEAASRAKSELIANVSHELRTPLGAIQGFADILTAEMAGFPEVQEATSAIRRNCRNLLELVDDLLDLSKLEAGLFKADNSTVLLLPFVNEIFAFLSPIASQKNLIFSVQALTSLPTEFGSDSRRLRQILLNLLSNAIKFTDSGRVVLEISYASTTRTLSFDVIDSGPGISESFQSSLFEPFHQGDSSVNRKHGGTGLGLALSRKLAQGLGATLLLKSSSENGTVFTCQLPIACEPAQIIPMEFKPYAALTDTRWSRNMKQKNSLWQKRILIVEDCLDNQRIYSRYLELAGAQVYLASSGIQAVQLLKKSLPAAKKSDGSGSDLVLVSFIDAILMDLQMPQWDGFTTALEIRKLGLQMPIFGVSASAFHSERERCTAGGFAAFMLKPVEPDYLIETLSEYLKAKSNHPVRETILAQDSRMQELNAQFVRGLEKRIDEMRSCVKAGNQGRFFQLIHQLKGTARNYGYAGLAALAEKVELQTQTEKWDEALTEIEKERLAILFGLARQEGKLYVSG